MKALRRLTATLVFSITVSFAGGAASAAIDELQGGSAKALSNWSGWWIPQFVSAKGKELDAENHVDLLAAPPLKAEYMDQFQKLVQAMVSGQDANAVYQTSSQVYCRPFRFNGIGLLGLEFESALEFLFNPGRITVADELGHLRRVYMNSDEPMRRRLHLFGETNTGISIGHWEGRTLVVETSGLSHQARFSFANNPFGGVEFGKNARVTERIFLKREDVLQVDSVIVAPDALTVPYKRTLLYQRDTDHVPHEFSYCNEYDREIDPVTGKQRFDLTPPADLPPPPSE